MNCVVPQDRAVLVGTMAACTGDRSDALQQLLSGPIKPDALVGDYLAEINLSWRAAEMEKDEALKKYALFNPEQALKIENRAKWPDVEY